MARKNRTTNSGKNPVDRNDLWASGWFDFLIRPGISEKYRKRILAIKEEAIKSVKIINNHYPNVRK